LEWRARAIPLFFKSRNRSVPFDLTQFRTQNRYALLLELL
jgi:hypothetical protein